MHPLLCDCVGCKQVFPTKKKRTYRRKAKPEVSDELVKSWLDTRDFVNTMEAAVEDQAAVPESQVAKVDNIISLAAYKTRKGIK